ncbi:hypothetical protein ACJIZ3_014221 [Penstemon smallii]|uniref:Uncharacterized protein n=1 Tax=Penstemon smallii TaxID=265156 RepID=A0ABD3RJA4_9LAMI
MSIISACHISIIPPLNVMKKFFFFF